MMESKPDVLFPFLFQKEIKPGACEDAPPVATNRYSIVCDGLGGAGHTKHSVPDGQNSGAAAERTSAYLGSRIAANCVEEFFREYWEEWALPGQEPLEIGKYAASLKKKLDSAIQGYVDAMHITLPLGKTIKIFPTTLASAAYMPCEDGIRVAAIWAGDSRVYVLTPSKGLQLLSLDDADGAAEAMNSGTVMTNCIYAGSFYLNYCVYTLREPGIVFCCSDGCFDYLRSPLHLEWLLLHMILNAPQEDGREPGEILAERIRDGIYQVIRDDTTMAGLCFRFPSLASMQEAFRPRMERLDPMAAQMNGYITERNAAQDALDQAKKVCHLYENKVSDAIQDAVCGTVRTKVPESLYETLMGLEAFSGYGKWEAEGLRQLKAEFEKRERKVDGDIQERNRQCRSLFALDCIAQQVRPLLRSRGPVWGSKFGFAGEAAPDAQNLDAVLATLMELAKLEEFWELSPEFDWEMQQNLRFMLGKLRQGLNQDGGQYRPLLNRAYLSSDLFDEQRKALEQDPQFQSAYRELLKNPKAYSFCSARTREAARSLRAAKAERENLRERYQEEKRERQRELAVQYCEKQKKQVLEELLDKPPQELTALLEDANLPVQTVLGLADARKKLRRSGEANPAEKLEEKIQGLWSEYRKEYELFKQVERGRT